MSMRRSSVKRVAIVVTITASRLLFFAGAFGLADISFIPPLANYERASYSIPGHFRNLRAWWERLKSRPSFDASWPL